MWVNEVRNSTRREVYSCYGGCQIDYYDPTYDHTFGRSEGQPARGIYPITGKPTEDTLYDRLEIVRRYYLDMFNRNGANGQNGLGDGSFVPVTTARAYLRDEQGGENDGYYLQVSQWSALIGILGHEYSHSVSLNGGAFLIHGVWAAGMREPDALNEHFAELQGHGFEQYLLGTANWLEGQGQEPWGVAFNWANPKDPNTWSYGLAPDSYYAPYFSCSNSSDEHFLSSVTMYAAYLISAGGTFNGCTMHGIGLDRTLQIWYRPTRSILHRRQISMPRTYM